VGEEFAFLEATTTLAMVLRRFEFDFAGVESPGKTGGLYEDHPQGLNHPVGMRTGATIHTRKGLAMTVRERSERKAEVSGARKAEVSGAEATKN